MLDKSESEFKLSAMPSKTTANPGIATHGVHAAKQTRSQLKHQALLQAGRQHLATHDLATLSVARLTHDAGMAVGSFYSRFADKDAWFAELLRVTGEAVLDETLALLASPRWAQASDERKVALIVSHIVGVHRNHRGIMRAALGDQAHAAQFGAPVHAYGRRIADAVHEALAHRMREVPAAQRRLRVGIALQLVYGTLMNAVLRDPGPIRLDDARMERELTRVFLGTVQLG